MGLEGRSLKLFPVASLHEFSLFEGPYGCHEMSLASFRDGLTKRDLVVPRGLFQSRDSRFAVRHR